ncbi:hypothetical protein [Streptomyces sp. AC555_RSS877]|uniref:hypothetical protein n=1 Tax=Streptomyces sp. AC555_RSS877 TaxID=2823688 RepID=UPI001C25BB79|nr:hypothetical protein [Streptomyces sp. AC555_RSS877]
MGVVVGLAGAVLVQGAAWAGAVGLGLVGLAMLAINASVIWALCTAPTPTRR